MCGGIVGRILPNAPCSIKQNSLPKGRLFSVAPKSLLARKKEKCGENCEDRRDYQKGFMNGEVPDTEIVG